jgi:hypothetical protein
MAVECCPTLREMEHAHRPSKVVLVLPNLTETFKLSPDPLIEKVPSDEERPTRGNSRHVRLEHKRSIRLPQTSTRTHHRITKKL